MPDDEINVSISVTWPPPRHQHVYVLKAEKTSSMPYKSVKPDLTLLNDCLGFVCRHIDTLRYRNIPPTPISFLEYIFFKQLIPSIRTGFFLFFLFIFFFFFLFLKESLQDHSPGLPASYMYGNKYIYTCCYPL